MKNELHCEMEDDELKEFIEKQYSEKIKDCMERKEASNYFKDDYHRFNYVAMILKNDFAEYMKQVDMENRRKMAEFCESLPDDDDDSWLLDFEDEDSYSDFGDDGNADADNGDTVNDSAEKDGTVNGGTDNTDNGCTDNGNANNDDTENGNAYDSDIGNIGDTGNGGAENDNADNDSERPAADETPKPKRGRPRGSKSKKKDDAKKYKPKNDAKTDKPRRRRGRPRKNGDTEQRRLCLCCGKRKFESDFMKSPSIIYRKNGGYLTVCRGCMMTLYRQYKKKYQNQFAILDTQIDNADIEKLALKRICMKFDLFYSDSSYETARKHMRSVPSLDLMSAYSRALNLKQNRCKSYDDTIIEEDMSQELIESSLVERTEIQELGGEDEFCDAAIDLCVGMMALLKKRMALREANSV